MAGDVPDWRIYERVAACFEIESAGMDVSVTPNASLVGSISGVNRQIDILVDARWEQGIARRIIYDAKRRRRKLNVNDVESFEGMIKDVRASRGVLICSNGWTEAAERRSARNIDIRLMTVEEADDFDHAATEPCPNCQIRKRKQKGIVFWDGQFPLPLDAWSVIFTGKCDVCRSFAFWCWECGEKVVVPDNEKHKCGCERVWFVEENIDEALFVVRVEDGEVPLDRRPKK